MDSTSMLKARNFPSAHDEAVAQQPIHRYEGPESAYRMAFADNAFLLREELRPVRVQLELMKPELIQQDQGVESTIVVFGSARLLPGDIAAERLAEVRQGGDAAAIKRAERQVELSRYYEEARRFGELVTREAHALGEPVIISTGGGPGIMEAGNRGYCL